ALCLWVWYLGHVLKGHSLVLSLSLSLTHTHTQLRLLHRQTCTHTHTHTHTHTACRAPCVMGYWQVIDPWRPGELSPYEHTSVMCPESQNRAEIMKLASLQRA